MVQFSFPNTSTTLVDSTKSIIPTNPFWWQNNFVDGCKWLLIGCSTAKKNDKQKIYGYKSEAFKQSEFHYY